MGDVTINPTGFAHGFRPLEGDHPPPTPTQRDMISVSNRDHSQHRADFHGLSFSNAASQATDSGDIRGRNDGPARKRRRLPGPLAFLQHGDAAGRSGFGDHGRNLNEDGEKDNGHDREDKGEVGGGHFEKGPWLSVCSAVDAPIPEQGASDTEAIQVFLSGALSPMCKVLAGEFDLRVPIVMAVVDVYTRLSPSDTAVELVDPSGRMKGYLHPVCVEEHGHELGPGAALLLKEVSIFVSGPGTTRLLNIHPDCVLAVFPLVTPLPPPARLAWLRNCGPPFTPRPVHGAGSNAPPRSDRRLSPPSTPSSTAPTSRSYHRKQAPSPAKGNAERTSQQQSPSPTRQPPSPGKRRQRQGYREAKSPLPTAQRDDNHDATAYDAAGVDMSRSSSAVQDESPAERQKDLNIVLDMTVSSQRVGQGSNNFQATHAPSVSALEAVTPVAAARQPLLPAQSDMTHSPTRSSASNRTACAATTRQDSMSRCARENAASGVIFPRDVERRGVLNPGTEDEWNVRGGGIKTAVPSDSQQNERELASHEGEDGAGQRGDQQAGQDRDFLCIAPGCDNGGIGARQAAAVPKSIWTDLGGIDSDDSEGDLCGTDVSCSSISRREDHDHDDAAPTSGMSTTRSHLQSPTAAEDKYGEKSISGLDGNTCGVGQLSHLISSREVKQADDHPEERPSAEENPRLEDRSRPSGREAGGSLCRPRSEAAGWTFNLSHQGGTEDAFLDAALLEDDDDCDLYL